MFTYYYRIRDRYQREITAWAIFSDRNKEFKPEKFEKSFLGTNIQYQFNTYKILDQSEDELRSSNNPFAVVILTVLLALKKGRGADSNLLNLKIELAKNLLSKGFEKEKVRATMNFLRFYVRLDTEKDRIFEKQLETITGKNYPMGIEELILEQERKARTIEIILASYDEGLKIPQIARITQLAEEEVLQILVDHGKIS